MPDFFFHKPDGHGALYACQYTNIVQLFNHTFYSQLMDNVAGFEVDHLETTTRFDVLAFQFLLQRQAFKALVAPRF